MFNSSGQVKSEQECVLAQARLHIAMQVWILSTVLNYYSKYCLCPKSFDIFHFLSFELKWTLTNIL